MHFLHFRLLDFVGLWTVSVNIGLDSYTILTVLIGSIIWIERKKQTILFFFADFYKYWLSQFSKMLFLFHDLQRLKGMWGGERASKRRVVNSPHAHSCAASALVL